MQAALIALKVILVDVNPNPVASSCSCCTLETKL